MSGKNTKPKRGTLAKPPMSRSKIWCFRLVLLLGVPISLLGIMEIALRVAGFGYPVSFLLPSQNHGQKTFIQNNQFGWRFFGPRMARQPHPISILREKAAGTIRIFVFGESAAYGDPQPQFGLPRMLEAMLELRYPGTKFEVVNAGMTAINSHAIVPIARDCSHAEGDIWVIYMGNNEVVGPFGSGTVFGPQAPGWPLIRTGLALKATRTGQLLNSFAEAFRPSSASKNEWGGMMMFLDERVRATDSRMANVYRNFDRNLADIIQAGREHGTGMVISTVAVNLKDCAPFASLHRPDLSAEQLANWDGFFKRGVSAETAGDWPEARSSFRDAAAIDDSFAELRFRLGQCASALNEPDEAVKQFSAARDLDALRFRCDSRLNDLIRHHTAGREDDRILLADAEHAFAEASDGGLPGLDLFYEHVHLTFKGNYLLAGIIARQMERLLPKELAATNGSWPEMADCAARLAMTSRATQQAISEVYGRLADPPFTWQCNHDEQLRHLETWTHSLPPPDSPASLDNARSACEAALARWPDDPLLEQQLAELKQASGDHAGAAEAARHSLDLLPSNSQAWLLLGLALAQQQKYEEATAAFRQILLLDSQDVWGRQNLALCLQKLGRRDEAISEFKTTVKIKPRFGLAWLGLGQIYEEMGKTNDAELCFQEALTNRVHRADELTTLARFCQSRKWYEAAATNYAEAMQLSPSDASLRLEAGQVLANMGRHTEAARCFAEAGRLLPDSMQAHFLLGVELGQLNRPDEAEKEFREAVRLKPDLVEAWINLGIALYQQRKFDQARDVFNEVLQRNPLNATALKYAEALRPQTHDTPAK